MIGRVGTGFDVHPFADGRPLVLGGVPLDGPGLAGHSDGDAVAHAVADAILGPAGLGDLGSMFPASDPAFSGADSMALLAEVARRVEGAGWRLVNVDVVVVAEQPRLAEHVGEMASRLTTALGSLVADDGSGAPSVSVRPKFAEGIGSLGRAEGIAVLATALLTRSLPFGTMLRLHDTLSGEVVDFVPRHEGRVAMYVCGPTVYDVPHLGHARSALVFDVIRRYFMWRGADVTFAMNITDIDDKIIARAAEEGSSEEALSATYARVYWDQMRALGILPPDHAPHATEYVNRMQELIAELVDAGRAYVVEGSGVYFDVESWGDEYGALPHRSLEQLRESAGARVDVDETKRSPLDFALWKAAKPGEPTWESPWGPGRPGWHIECAAMSLDLLGDGFDIHGGGDDLTFPHHENERAEAVAAGHPFARYWLHNGMVITGGEKMSKSLGNFVTLADALDEFDPRALRMVVLQTHYRSQVEMGREQLRAAEEAVERLDALARRAAVAGTEPGPPDAAIAARFRAAMDDDFNTPEAMAAVFDAVRSANTAIDAASDQAGPLLGAVLELTQALGLKVARRVGESDAELDRLVAERDEARRNRDFATADRIRDELAAQGVVLEDTPGGTVWHRGSSR